MKNKLAYAIVRVILGLAWLLSGIMKFLPMQDAPLPQAALDYMAAMVATGFMMPFIGVAEVLVGVALLANFWVPFAMMILSALMVNIVLFNVFLAFSVVSAVMLLILLILQSYIMYCTWDAYKPLFSKKTRV